MGGARLERAMKMILSGGGTGGHLFPGLAIAEAVRDEVPGAEILFVGGNRLEARVVPQAGWPFRAIAGRGLPRRLGFGTLAALGSIALGGWQALRIVWSYRPDVVVATGGYVAAPVGVAAWLRGTPLVLQEQNIHPGLTNRVLARFARVISIPHADGSVRFGRRRTEVTGVPIRRSALDGERPRGIQRWGLDPKRTTILVLGGSQGARSLNQATCRLGDLLLYDQRVQILHHTGAEDLHWVRESIGRRQHVGPGGIIHVPVGFLDPIGDAYACADLVVCRAGASTLAEVTAWGLPSVVVPYPFAANRHQDANAAVLVRAGAAKKIADSDLGTTSLVETVQLLIGDVPRRATMAKASRGLGHPDAAGVVARLVIAVARARGARKAVVA
jgi:UDP-N-acetylglucosamine--N-acetylmuramyl-(pentapeptide) pyrophosphoryl-undecaprenol N-acetylglucosamine transferase